MFLQGKIVVITGASSGFGKGAALKFAERGATVILAARREAALEEVARECAGKARVIPTDVSHPDEVSQLAASTLAEFGRIDVWVNDAGVGAIGRFDEIPLEDHKQVIETNLLGVIYGSYFALKQFRQQKQGVLINVASVLGKIPAPYYSSYTASKYGIVGFNAALRQELDQSGEDAIKVCTVMPMAHDTPFFEHAGNYTGHEVVPIPPVYDPQGCVDAIVELAENPEDEIIVGTQGKVSAFLHQLTPGMMEKLMGAMTHKKQIEDAPPAPDTAGSVHEPQPEGTTVEGGHR